MAETLDKRPLARGRGALANPTGRFERLDVELERTDDDEPEQVKTQIYKDTAKSIVNFNDSPDIGFSASLNPYRGCEHGCIYCYARPGHEYFGLSAGIDFESKIFVKEEAPKLLRETLAAPNWKPQCIMLSGITDVYQPLERTLQVTRGCLEVLAEFRNPVSIITKNYLVTRDIDYLAELAKYNAVHVSISITTLNPKLARIMEPRASRPDLRLKAVRQMSEAGIPVGIMMAPIIPGLTDEEIPALLKAAVDAGAQWAGYTIVRLPYGVKHLFEQWLEEHMPDRKDKVLHRIMEMRGGKLNDPNFGSRMRGNGIYAETIRNLFKLTKKQLGLDKPTTELSTESFRRVTNQLTLF